MRSIARSIPVSLVLLAAVWLTFAVRAATGVALGVDLPGDSELWHIASSGLTSGHPVGLLFSSLAWAAFAVPAEVSLGSRRFLVAAAASQAVAVPAGLVAATFIEHAGFNQWGTDLANETFLSPVAWIFGPAAVATAGMGVLWRRRLRLVMLALTGTLVLYSGALSDVVALSAVLLGWAAGSLISADTGPAWHMSLRESRVMVATLVAAVSTGPVLTALNPAAEGPFAGVSKLMWEPALASHQVAHRCRDVASTACQEAIAINQQNGVGPFLLNLVPLALMLVIALGLARGRRLAWLLAVAATVGSLVGIAAQVGGVGGDAMTNVNVVLVELPWLGVLAVLAATRRRFAVGSEWRPAVARVLAALATTAAVWTAGAMSLRHGFLTPTTPGSVLAELPIRYLPPAVAVLMPHYLVPRTAAAWALYEWVGIVFWAVALYLLFRVLSSPPSAAAEQDRARARAMLERGTGDHLAWMGLWDGNRYFFHGEDGYVAYRVSRNVAVTVGGPVWCGAVTRGEVADAFEDFAAEQGWRAAWYSVDQDFARPGRRGVHVAEESLMYTDNLEFKGKKFQNIRTARNRAAKEGVRAVWTSWAECDVETRDKIIALSEEWVADKALPEMGFTLGGVEELADPGTRLLIALDEAGHLHGVTSWLPVYEDGRLVGYTLDFMRRDAGGFRPVIEFLLAEAAVVAGGEGLEWVSLSGAPLARTDTPTSLVEVLLDKTGATIEPLYGFRSLAASKYKFHPAHRGWYLLYDDEMALPSIALAVVDCYLPDMRRSDVVTVAREFFSRRQQSGRDRAAESSPGGGSTHRP
ncbi:bifunctional lysylphosphatidylglycerol flippase/synthetase MprF [uncultured Corynebacterium sp.]|uniref:bifunctional lysylphosphatidylglycerol flippase/synthetase MprF n=1 Tax=uncultured Corynebacterium sp. TaxID=159447 RepID=UPI002592FC08|nr:DUF2156 domain-containing protein [uncultured Corynebacterium sp.]